MIITKHEILSNGSSAAEFHKYDNDEGILLLE